jgi:UDP-N-acetylglucosamine:LPS N-acetylglucosamine transferase
MDNNLKKITILYTDSGAGHKSIAKSLFDELSLQSGISATKTNFAKEFHLKGFESPEKTYKFFIKYLPWIYGLIVYFVNIKLITNILKFFYNKSSSRMVKEFVQKYDSDLYISTYYFDIELFREIKKIRSEAKFIIYVADIVFPLRIWFDPLPNLTIVPTDEIYLNAKKYFSDFQNKIKILGLPISKAYYEEFDKNEIRNNLGINSNKTILISGGGEGMKKIGDIVSSIDITHSNINVIVICGKDQQLFKQLSDKKYNNNVIIRGWVDNFSDYLKASDIVITKAGPTTIWECLTLGKHMIIYDYIKGQENGNYEFASKYGKAIFETDTMKISLLINNAQTHYDVPTKFKTDYSKSFAEMVLSSIL